MLKEKVYLRRATEIPICIHVGSAGGTVTVIISEALIMIIDVSLEESDPAFSNQAGKSMKKPKMLLKKLFYKLPAIAITARIEMNLKESE